MAQLARGYSFVMYLAEAGATYSVPFPFLHADDVRVFAGDVGDAVQQQFTWQGPTEIKLVSDVPEGILLTIRRFTPRDDLLVHIKDGANLPAADLNTTASQLLYVMQEQLDFGTYGGSGLPGGGSGWPNPGGGSTSLDIQQIVDQLLQAPVMQELVARIDPIDSTAETMLEELIRSEQFFDNRREVARRLAFVQTDITTLQDDTKSLAQQTTELYAQYDNVASQVVSVQQALSTESEARASDVEQINAAVADNKSQITSAKQAIADEASARATAITKVESDYKSADDSVSQAINQTLQSTYATKDYAQSTAQTQVEAFAAGNFATLQERFEALVDGSADPSSSSSWQANWSIRLNGGQIDGTPVVAGIGLGIDSKTGSNFIVMADRFGIVSPTYTSTGGVQQMKYPFVVGTVGGVSTVGITGQLIVDGSVTADKLKVNSLAALTANMGEVNGGTFRTFTLDANGAIVDPNEFRVEVSNTGTWPLWIGAGVKNANNGVMWVDRSGNAAFKGTVSAPNITSELQRVTPVKWSGSLATGPTDTFVLDAPVRPGESHIAVMTFSLSLKNTWNNQKEGANIVVEYLNGSVWTVMTDQWFWLQGADQTSLSISAISPSLTARTQFRVRIYNNTPDGALLLLGVTGYIIGVR